MKTYVVSLMAIAGVVAGCNQSIESASRKFNELPTAVQKTARAEAPNDEIAAVSRNTENGMAVYEISFRKQGSNPKVVIAADGKLISTEMPKPAGAVERLLTPTGATGTKFSALPEKAQKTIQARSPDAEIADITRHEKDGRVIYEVAFRDKGANPTIQVAEDGTLVQDLPK